MEFTGADILRLYGERFFLIEEAQSQTPEAVDPNAAPPQPEQETPPSSEPFSQAPLPLHLLEQGPAIVWKMKPGATVAMVLRKQEFSNRNLTNLLKTAIVKAGIDTALIGFGILEDEAASCNLSDGAVPLVLLCDTFQTIWPEERVALASTQVWLSPNLENISQSTDHQALLARHLAAIKAAM